MAAATSPATGRRYGVARICGAWEVPRSSFYAARVAADGTRPPASPARRGPKPAVSDADLLAAIRADLARSPWTGEGRRKVWARLRAMDGLRVSRKRVLRLMREHALLSPHRARPRGGAAQAPDRHGSAGRHVGDRRDPDHHRRGRQGVAVRRRRALER